ncbi:MAG: hypothetical protein EON47_23545 [Acetobacteraceae bacterium]|nr:MAG: hypothetical protein EON47_23545 [Acetobacteraceae bacterium]
MDDAADGRDPGAAPAADARDRAPDTADSVAPRTRAGSCVFNRNAPDATAGSALAGMDATDTAVAGNDAAKAGPRPDTGLATEKTLAAWQATAAAAAPRGAGRKDDVPSSAEIHSAPMQAATTHLSSTQAMNGAADTASALASASPTRLISASDSLSPTGPGTLPIEPAANHMPPPAMPPRQTAAMVADEATVADDERPAMQGQAQGQVEPQAPMPGRAPAATLVAAVEDTDAALDSPAWPGAKRAPLHGRFRRFLPASKPPSR